MLHLDQLAEVLVVDQQLFVSFKLLCQLKLLLSRHVKL